MRLSLPKARQAICTRRVGWSPDTSGRTPVKKDGAHIPVRHFHMAGPLTETVLMGNLATRSYMLRDPGKKGGYTYPGTKATVMGW